MNEQRIIALHDEHGQSPWLDNLKRSYITSGRLVEFRDSGVRGLTSNPSIFQKAIQNSDDYDEQFGGAEPPTRPPRIDDYWAMVIRDIHSACDVFSKVYDHSDGVDGYVSVEVDPGLAHDGPRHRGSCPWPARADPPPQPDGEDPRHRRRVSPRSSR